MRHSFSSGSLLLKGLDAVAETEAESGDQKKKSVGESTMQFTFAHPLIHKILYDLTPVSVKSSIHAALARDIEEKYPGNSIYFSSLGYRKCPVLLSRSLHCTVVTSLLSITLVTVFLILSSPLYQPYLYYRLQQIRGQREEILRVPLSRSE